MIGSLSSPTHSSEDLAEAPPTPIPVDFTSNESSKQASLSTPLKSRTNHFPQVIPSPIQMESIMDGPSTQPTPGIAVNPNSEISLQDIPPPITGFQSMEIGSSDYSPTPSPRKTKPPVPRKPSTTVASRNSIDRLPKSHSPNPLQPVPGDAPAQVVHKDNAVQMVFEDGEAQVMPGHDVDQVVLDEGDPQVNPGDVTAQAVRVEGAIHLVPKDEAGHVVTGDENTLVVLGNSAAPNGEPVQSLGVLPKRPGDLKTLDPHLKQSITIAHPITAKPTPKVGPLHEPRRPPMDVGVVSPSLPEGFSQTITSINATTLERGWGNSSATSANNFPTASLDISRTGNALDLSLNTLDATETLLTPSSTQGSILREKDLKDQLDLVDESLEELSQSEGSPPDSREAATNPNRICYRLLCKDMENTKKQVIRYSWKPFEGLQPDHNEDKARQELAVMDVADMIEGQPLRTRQNQLRNNFGTSEDKDPDPFVVGVDYFARSTYPTGLRIHSPHIQSVLRALILYYPGVDIQDKEMSCVHPFEVLFHYWDDLQQIVAAFEKKEESIMITNSETGSEISIVCDQITYDHLQVLLTSGPIEKAYREIYAPEKRLHAQGLASYNNLWVLFKPGEIVFTKVRGKLTGFVVMSVDHFPYHGSGSSAGTIPYPLDKWRIYLWNLAYNDQKIIRQSHVVFINRYNGEKKISELPVFPTKFLENQAEAKKELIKRGERYHRIICDDQRHMRYNGFVVAEKPYHYQGDIIVDHGSYKLEVSDKSYMQMLNLFGEEPKDTRGEPLFSKFNDMKCSPDNPLEQVQYLLLPGYVLGFALGKKEWAIFDMACVEEIPLEINPMEYLIIDKDSSDLILAAAGPPREGTALKPWTTEWSADFIEGKGKGKVVLLHGSPGTGKTMTAECIAKYTKRPLISLSAAELGTAEVKMEQRLVKWLDRATMWGAIVLIDEAEVYVEQRQSKDLARNALVTAFLRTMEYFPGLLYLTTNGVGLFDEAIMSRIHLSIRYKKPTDGQRRDIWNSLFDKLARDQRNEKKAREERAARQREHAFGTSVNDDVKVHKSPLITIEESAQKLALGTVDLTYHKLKLNGREIRNILLAAISVARHDVYMKLTDKSQPLDEIIVTSKHLESVLKNKMAFRMDYELARGATTEKLAEENMIRAMEEE